MPEENGQEEAESIGLKRLKRDFGAAFKKLTELGLTEFPDAYVPTLSESPLVTAV